MSRAPRAGAEIADLCAWIVAFRSSVAPVSTPHARAFDDELASVDTIDGLAALRARWDAPVLSRADRRAPGLDVRRAAVAEDCSAVLEGMRARGLDAPTATWAPWVDLLRHVKEPDARRVLASDDVQVVLAKDGPRKAGIRAANLLLGDSLGSIAKAVGRFGIARKAR